MADVKFRRGLLSELPSSLNDGSIYITLDEGGMYVDTNNKRVRLGDFIAVDTINDLPSTGHAYETAVYYVKENNILARWDATNNRWIQINKAGVVSVTDDPSNPQGANVVSSITTTTDAQGRLSLVVTKTTVATSSAITNLEDIVSQHTSQLATITGTGVGSITKAVSDARDALLGNPTTYTTIEALETALAAVKTTADNAAAAAATNASAIENLQNDVSGYGTRISNAETAISVINGSGEGSISKAVGDEATLRETADNALGDRIDSLGNSLTSDETQIEANANAISAIESRLGSGDESLESRVTANEEAITTLNGNASTEGSVRNIVAEKIAEVINDAPAAFDTLKDIAEWIGENSDDAITMQNNIAQNATDISSLQSDVGDINEALTSLDDRLDTAEENITIIQGQITTLNGDSSTQGSVDYKIAQALTTIDNSIDGVSDSLSALETRVGNNESAIGIINGSGDGSISKAVGDEAALRTAADTALSDRIDGLDGTVGSMSNAISTIQNDVSDLQSSLTWKAFTGN